MVPPLGDRGLGTPAPSSPRRLGSTPTWFTHLGQSCPAGDTWQCLGTVLVPRDAAQHRAIHLGIKALSRTGCGGKGSLVHCWWECRLVQPLWKAVWNFLRKIKNETAFDPVISLLGIYPKDPETPNQKTICIPMLIVVLFTIAKVQKQLKSHQ